ncbi:WecB/TagA/CpsF family glycosyltransferase [Vibrio owensii]|uniref:WecB/TagA/CpsF family glycosyltransferase n=1 Tax=Vibrio owensii TaxID=696485 RepID=UPI0033978668
MKYKKELDLKIIATPPYHSSMNTQRGGAKVFSFVNPFSYEIISNDKDLIENVDGWFVDGALLCKLMKWKHKVEINRTSFDFSSIADSVLSCCDFNKLKVCIIGATNNELDIAMSFFRKKYRQADFCITSDGYLCNNKESSLLCDIAEKEPDVFIIGMGTPYQEKLSLKIKSLVSHDCIIYTCGGFITQTSIRDDYYYPLVKKFNLRAFQRFLSHSHVRERVIKKYPPFVIKYLLG